MPTSQTFSFTIILAEKRNNVNKKAVRAPPRLSLPSAFLDRKGETFRFYISAEKPPAGEGDGEVSSVPFTGISPWIIMVVLLILSGRREVNIYANVKRLFSCDHGICNWLLHMQMARSEKVNNS